MAANTTGVGAEIYGPLPSPLANATVLGFPFFYSGLSDYVVLVRLLLTGITTTPAPVDGPEPLAWWAWLLISLGGIILVAMLGMGVYNVVVARQMQDKMNPASNPATGAYVKIIQVDLAHP
jgi:hypothetical protein